jgi:cytoplasmic tRNA 2-thiolation protein 1
VRSTDNCSFNASSRADSTVLAFVLTKLNKERDYGLDLSLLSIDEGITGYRDDSLEVWDANSRASPSLKLA